MKKIQAFFAAVLLAATTVSSISSSAVALDLENLPDDVFVYDNWLCTLSLDGDSVALVGVVDTSVTSITIPAKINGLPVVYMMDTSNGYDVYQDLNNCKNLTEILVDKENQYFESMDGVLFSKNLQEICAYPCNHETEVYAIPDNTYWVALNSAFKNCNNLKELIFPETLSQNENRITIENCKLLEKITNLGTLNHANIGGCPNLKEINLKNPEDPVRISRLRFQNLGNLETLCIPENYNIGTALVVQTCPELNHLTLPGYMSSKAEISVLACDSLESLDFSNIRNDEPISDYQFTKLNIAGCPELKEIQLPEVTCYTITDCPKLTSLSFDTDNYISSIELQSKNSGLRDLYFYSKDSYFYNLKIVDSEYARIPGQEDEADYRSLADMGVTIHCRKADVDIQNACETYNIPYVFIEDEVIPGDVRNDGELDITDAVMLNRIAVGVEKSTPSRQMAGDLNGNGKLELTDSMAILRKLVGLDA